MKQRTAEEIVSSESGARIPQHFLIQGFISLVCVVWAIFQLYIAVEPTNSIYSRSWHLAFSLFLVFLCFPAYAEKSPEWYAAPFQKLVAKNEKAVRAVGWVCYGIFAFLCLEKANVITLISAIMTENSQRLAQLTNFMGEYSSSEGLGQTAFYLVLFSIGTLLFSFFQRAPTDRVNLFDWCLAFLGGFGGLYYFLFHDELILRAGLPILQDVIMGVLTLFLLLEGARRCLGIAMPILSIVFILYMIYGASMPAIIQHKGMGADLLIGSLYFDSGIYGVPLSVSTSYIFIFVLFGALLERAGAGKYFIDLAYSLLGTFTGGPAKASVVASGMTGMISGSSIANTVTTGTFTIPLMRKIGLPAYKAGAIEVASSTNGQLMPPIMGAAAFIMAQNLGIGYIDVVRAAWMPAVISYIALFWLVHLEAKKMGLKRISRSELPSPLQTFLKGIHFNIPILVLMYFLLVERVSPILSAFYGIMCLMVIMLFQHAVKDLIPGKPGAEDSMPSLPHQSSQTAGKPNGKFGPIRSLRRGLGDIFHGTVAGSRSMVTIGIATAAAGIIVSAVSSTGLAGRLTEVIGIISSGSVLIMLCLTALTSILLGMGLPTTANYIIVSALTAPVIIEMGAQAGIVFPIIAAHLFVFYFGILADDTPPVGLAAYAAAAIAKSDPIKTGVQGFTYDLRTAILPFVFIFNYQVLSIRGFTKDESTGQQVIQWIENPWVVIGIFVMMLVGMFAFTSALQGFLLQRTRKWERLALLLVAAIIFFPTFFIQLLDRGGISFLDRNYQVQLLGVVLFAGLVALQVATFKEMRGVRAKV